MGAEVAMHDYRIIDALNADWDQMRLLHHHEVSRWSSTYPALAGCLQLEDVLARVGSDADGVFAALLTENARGEELAGRVVLQAMLGKLVRMASRDPHGGVGDYVAGLWCGIQTYPLRQRASRIAANLALDTLKTVTQERRWARGRIAVLLTHEEGTLDHYQSAAQARERQDHSPIAELSATSVIAAAGALGLIDDQTREVLLTVYSDGLAGEAAARRHGTTPAMVRYRCSRAVRRLARDPTRLAMAA